MNRLKVTDFSRPPSYLRPRDKPTPQRNLQTVEPRESQLSRVPGAGQHWGWSAHLRGRLHVGPGVFSQSHLMTYGVPPTIFPATHPSWPLCGV